MAIKLTHTQHPSTYLDKIVMRLIDVDECITSDLSNQLESPSCSLNFNQLLASLLGFIALNLINEFDDEPKMVMKRTLM